jgi:hypothetical protein
LREVKNCGSPAESVGKRAVEKGAPLGNPATARISTFPTAPATVVKFPISSQEEK